MSLPPMKLYAIMMAYNEMPFLSYVTERLLKVCDHLIVMDNGSSDGSREWISWRGASSRYRSGVTPILNQQAGPPNHAEMLNRMLQYVPDGAWVLKWDPDELPSDGMVRGLGDFLRVRPHSIAWRIPVYDMMKSRTTYMPLSGYQQPRLFKKMPTTRFVGETHEHVEGLHWGRIGLDSDIAIIHLSYFCETRLRRKALHYAGIHSSGFLNNAKALTDRLDMPPTLLPDHITFQASDEWLETIRRTE